MDQITQKPTRSAKIRDYSIALICIAFLVLGAAFFLKILLLMNSTSNPITTRSVCKNSSANVFIGANEDLRGVKCVALDREFFKESEISIGDLTKGDEDVCRFQLSKHTTEPLRFEVYYNGRVKREVCEWQHYPRYVD